MNNSANSTTALPDPAFTAALEWQLRREIRRDAAPVATRQRPKTLTLIAVALASGLAGAACLGAAMQVQESRRGQVIIAGLTLRESAARQAADVARQMLKNTEAMHNAGTISHSDVGRAALRALTADTAARIIQLDLAEARASSQPARKDLAAPRINGRDFVLERLRVEQEQADAAAKSDADLLQVAVQRAAAGFASVAETAQAQLAAQLSRLAAADVADRIALRNKFIAGEISPKLAEQQDLQARALAARSVAQARLAAAQKTLDRVTALREAGAVSSAEVSDAQFNVASLQVELEIAKAELAALQTTP